MKIKISICVMVLMLLCGISHAQQRNRSERKQKAMLQLTDAQKAELRALKVEFAKATMDVKNELNELRAHQKTLMSAKQLNEKKIFENIDRMTVLKKQLMKDRIEMRLANAALLTNEQIMRQKKRSNHSKRCGQGMKQRKRKMRKCGRTSKFKGRQDRLKEFLNLSDIQHEHIKTLRLEHKNGMQNLREEIKELRLKQKHLLNDDQPDKKAIFSNIDRISVIQNQLAKKRVACQKEMRTILDVDQFVLFLSGVHKMKRQFKACTI